MRAAQAMGVPAVMMGVPGAGGEGGGQPQEGAGHGWRGLSF